MPSGGCPMQCGGPAGPTPRTGIRKARCASRCVRVGVAVPGRITQTVPKQDGDGVAVEESRCPFDHQAGQGVRQVSREESRAVALVKTPGPPPTGWESAMDVGKILFDGLHEAMLYFFEKYGPACRFANPTDLNGASGWLFINILDDIQYVCTKNTKNYSMRYLPDIYYYVTNGKGILGSQGEYNTKHRQLCQMPFRAPRLLEKFSARVVDRSLKVSEIFTRHGTFETDLANQTQRLALDIIGDVAFSYDFKETDQIDRDIQGRADAMTDSGDRLLWAVNTFGDVLGEMFITPKKILDFLYAIKFPRLVTLTEAIDTMRDSMLAIISERRKALASGMPAKDDLLNELLESKGPDGAPLMDDEELWEDVHDVMGAGHETTATTTATTIYLISKNPRVEAKVVEELDRVLGGRPATYDDIPNLTYLTQCVREMLRIYPVIPIFPRVAAEDDILPSGHVVNKGDVVFMSSYCIGRSKDFWDNPMEFRPERFEPELFEKMHRFQWAPFGAGPRMCLGANFAEMSVTLMVATLMQRHHYTPIYPNTDVLDIMYDITMNFNKTKGLKMRVEPRGAAA
eukprot:evm.model.scf_51.15 EVM.evm.TU.scf_51.15   scf_51:142967-148763(-)